MGKKQRNKRHQKSVKQKNDKPLDSKEIGEYLNKLLASKKYTDLRPILREFFDYLNKKGTPQHAMLASAFKIYLMRYLTPSKKKRKTKDKVKSVFSQDIFSAIESEHPGLEFRLEGRLKAILSTLDKFIMKINNGESPDSTNDLRAFRVTLNGSANECYRVLNTVLDELIIHKGYIFVEPDCMPSESFKKRKKLEKKIFVPKKTKIKKIYRTYVKDYIRFYKKNGYQCLHVCVRAPSGEIIEIQIRNAEMDNWANTYANHEIYKNGRYKEKLSYYINASKIRLSNNKFVQYAGKNKNKMYDPTKQKDTSGLYEPFILFTKDRILPYDKIFD